MGLFLFTWHYFFEWDPRYKREGAVIVKRDLNKIYLDHATRVNTTKAIQDDGGNAELNDIDHEN